MELCREAEYQYIDTYGKTRALIFSEGVSVYIDPIAPLNIPISHPKPSKIGTASKFIKHHRLEIIGMKSQGDKMIGLVFDDSEGKKCMILVDSKIDQNLPEINLPYYIHKKSSELRNQYDIDRLGYLLREYSLYEYMMNNRDDDIFVVVPDHEYDINFVVSDSFERYNDIFYFKKKLIVPNEKIMNNLKNYIQMFEKNYPNIIESYSDRLFLRGYYSKLEDFRQVREQIVFINNSEFEEWIKNRDEERNKVYNEHQPRRKEPYMFRGEDDEIVLIQNVEEGSKEKAEYVSMVWNRERINVGYSVKNEEKDFMGEKGQVIEYENGEYGAVLTLS